MLPSSGRSIGEQSVTTLPANRSIILADSRFRSTNPIDSPYDFNCDLSGTAIYAKEIFYQKLFWNQPLFAHNNDSVELRFSVQGYQMDPDLVFVVYVTPFVIFKEYDGNPPGHSFVTPRQYSYAANMDQALNTDVRTIPLNTTLYGTGGPNPGQVQDSAGNVVTMNFRYLPSRGFAIYATPNTVDGEQRFYGIRLRDCTYIRNAHFVHGFGIFNPDISFTEYVPHDMFLSTVFSDCSPNLLPSRYIVIQSQELNKDRRMISFHNGSFSTFVNELAIFAINPAQSASYHQVGVGDDATVISLRDDYTPQSFRIQILNEFGIPYRCDDPLGNLLQSPGVDPNTARSYTNPQFEPGVLPGRGNFDFINYLVFGYQRIFSGVDTTSTIQINATSPFPASQGMGNASINSQVVLNNTDIWAASLFECVPVSTFAVWSQSPLPQALGFSLTLNTSRQFLDNGPLYGYFTQMVWFPSLNPYPTIQYKTVFSFWALTGLLAPGKAYIALVMFDANTFQIIQVSAGNVSAPTNSGAPTLTFNNVYTSWIVNPNYVFPPAPNSINVGFAIAYVAIPTNPSAPYTFSGTYSGMYGVGLPPFTITFANSVQPTNVQTEYLPPVVDQKDYAFGDPLSDALCEETLHEIAAVLEYN